MSQISVIVPVYNVEPYLRRCVDSILEQTYRDFELILVDDGSPDNCGVICDEYAERDSRVVVIHQANGGLSAARNAGIDWAFANSDSQWLFFVDSDDFIHPESLQRLLDAAVELNVDISIGGYAETTGEQPAVEIKDLAPKIWETRDFFVEKNVNAIIACGKLCRKALFAQIRFPVGKLHEDEYTTYKLLFACESIVAVPAPLYGYYVNQEGITKAAWSPKRMDALGAFEERMDYFRKRQDKELFDHTVRYYARVIARQFEQAAEYPAQRRALRRKLARLMLRYHRLFSLRGDFWLYYTAFPRIFSRLRRVILGKKDEG